ncbi:MAG: hypothetical protein NT165_03135 [Candidatus Falkowbacteria bacterium]|nr:hypothetical protein [Candidatus Falkowbacteria bacterium]
MDMENFGPKIIGKIDLSAFQKKTEQKPAFRPEKFLPKLESILAAQSREVNESYGDFLDLEAKIKMTGAYAEKDQQEVDDIEAYFARGRQEELSTWKDKKKGHPATIAEMAVTAVLHKFIGQDFIVARASDYDDYKNGVDNILIDKKTGAVICGFDEVLGAVGDSGLAMKQEKLSKSDKKSERKRVGTYVKYGATVKSGELERRSMGNLPTFFLSLSREELMLLLEDINLENPAGGDFERKMFTKFTSLIKDQIGNSQEGDLDPRLRENLLASQEIINRL